MNRYTNLKIKDSIWIDCNRSRLFNFLTDAEKLALWWPESAESDPQVDGKLILYWQNNSSTASRFEVFIPDQRIAFPFGNEFVELTIAEDTEDSGRCLLSVCHSRITVRETSFDLLVHIAQSWTFLLINLKSVIEFGIDFRGSQV